MFRFLLTFAVTTQLAAVAYSQESKTDLSAQPPGNAAQSYRRAFAEIDLLPEAAAKIPEFGEPLLADDEFAHWDKQHEQVFYWLRQATEAGECDWRNDLQRKGAAAAFPHLAQARELARRAVFRARFNWHGKQSEQAIADVRCVIILARRIGDGGRTGLVGLTERYKMEQTVVDLVNSWLVDSDSAQRLEPLCRLALQPDGNLPKKGLLLEREMLVPWARRLVTKSDLTAEEQDWRRQFVGPFLAERGAPWILQQLDETESQYEQVGELLELPPAEFRPRFRDYLARLDGAGNPFSQMAIVECPGIPGAYWQSRKLRTEWTMLQTAAVVFQRGPEFVKETRDPYGEGAFVLSESQHGFSLQSALVLEGRPVTLEFERTSEGGHSPDSAEPKSDVGVDRWLRRMERAVADKDLAALRACFARDAVLVDPPEKGELSAPTFSREKLDALLELTLTHPTTKNADLLMVDGSGLFTLRQQDEVADLLLTSALRVNKVNDRPATIGLVERRFVSALFEAGQWRLAFSFPCFVESRVVVQGVAPGSQAERLGIRTGDVVTHHLQMVIFDSEQLVWRAKMFYDDPPATRLRVLVRRENRLLPIVFSPGEMGLETRSCFEGRSDTLTLTGSDARTHPAIKTIESYHRALRERDQAGLLAALSADGFFFCHGLPSAPSSAVLTHRDAAQTIAHELAELATRIQPATIAITDQRLIAYGDLALAGWHVSAHATDGGAWESDVVVCMTGSDEQWRIVGMPWQNGHVLGFSPPSSK